MKIHFAFLALFTAATSAWAAPENRCGWIDNPTPANISLRDADGEWLIGSQGGSQGGYQAQGDVTFPSDDKQRVLTNGSYGYFCGCVNATVDHKEKKILRIVSSKALPLARCIHDKKLDHDYVPRHFVHSNGKAYDECQDEDERQVGFQGRQACVSKDGGYYFISD